MGDSDAGEEKSNVPTWQVNSTQKPLQEDEKLASEPSEESREEILNRARKFLGEDEVKDAATDKKIAFLEAKGLGSDDIHELLGVSRNVEASSSATPALHQDTKTTPAEPKIQAPPSSPPPQMYTNSAPSQPQPPIITYPEFLTTAPHPEPLITKPRLLTTLYLFSSISLLLYGTSNYLVKPMVESLTTSRLSLSSTANTNLQKLIEKLEGMVSTIPDEASSKGKALHKGEGVESDSEDEDPTELFHRDIGIQTSPPHSRPSTPPPPSPVTTQTSSLTTLTTALRDLITTSSTESQNTTELTTTISEFREYLDGLAYVAPITNYGYGGYGGSSMGGGKEDDEIARVKAGIRGVKGVLLSARSFPGGVRGGR